MTYEEIQEKMNDKIPAKGVPKLIRGAGTSSLLEDGSVITVKECLARIDEFDEEIRKLEVAKEKVITALREAPDGL